MKAIPVSGRGLAVAVALLLGGSCAIYAGATASNRAVVVEVVEDGPTIKAHGDGFTVFAGSKDTVHIKVTPQPGWRITTAPDTELTPPASTHYAAEGARELTASGKIDVVPGQGTGHADATP